MNANSLIKFEQTILHQIKNCTSLQQLESIYTHLLKTNLNQDNFLMNQFITSCSNFNSTDQSIIAFKHMRSPNVFVYNALIKAFVHCNNSDNAVEVYLNMLRERISPTSYTFSSLIKGCRKSYGVRLGESVHCHVTKNGFDFNVCIATCLIDLYWRFGRVVDSVKVFDGMSERDVFAWTTMVCRYVEAGEMGIARRLFDEMPERNTATWNAMIDGYARMGNVECAKCLFRQMPSKDLISWTTVINCYSQQRKFREALEVFYQMRNEGTSPDAVTMATVISACAHLGALDVGKEIHYYMTRNAFDLDVFTGSALIDMYAKCGSLDRSLVVFFKLREKNLFCWNSIIEGLAVHGYAGRALEMIGKMERENIKPNGVTFISVLSACTHAGLVEEGRSMFFSMMRDYSISPQIEHYGCMIDLYGKAGLLEDALDLIRNMKVEPNSIIWGALLGGCKLHRNLEIAQLAADKLLTLEPNNTGHYTLLVNMNAEANRWGEVLKIRSAVKGLGIEKICPGSSWIEMEREVHQFVASDESHSSSIEIYSLLDALYGQLKLAFQEPDLNI